MVTEKKPVGKHIIKMHTGTSHVFEWIPTAEQMLTVDDWEEYVEPKKEPVFGHTKLTLDENGQPHMGDIMPVEELDLDAETNKAIALVAKNIAENLVELLQNPSVQRILQQSCTK